MSSGGEATGRVDLAAPEGNEIARWWRQRPVLAQAILGLLVLPAAGALLGWAAIAVARQGAGERPNVAAFILVVAAIAAVVPLQYGLPVAIVLGCFEGFLRDYVGPDALYWNEIFVGIVLLRSFGRRRPTRPELAAVGAFALLHLPYLGDGVSGTRAYWAAKVLGGSALAGWAVFRLRPGRGTWLATYYGLAVALAASVVLAAWQRHVGFERLKELGVTVNLTDAGDRLLRAPAGFTSAAPFAYALVIGALLWLAWLIDGRDRVTPASTAWVPACGAIGLSWTFDRIAVVGFALAVLVVGLRLAARRDGWKMLAVAGLFVGVLIAASPHSYRDRLVRAVTFRSPAVGQRLNVWRSYAAHLSLFGAGPGASGSAYEHVAPAATPTFRFHQWRWEYSASGVAHAVVEPFAVLTVDPGRHDRPAIVIRGRARSVGVDRTLTVSNGRRATLLKQRLSAAADQPITIAVPAGGGAARLSLGADPPEASADVAELRDLRISGLRPHTRAEAVYLGRFGSPPDAGVVDNQYLSWTFSYGVVAAAFVAAWLILLLWPLARIRTGALQLAAALVGVFLVLAAIGVNVAEESPTVFLGSLVLGQALAARQRRSSGRVPPAGPSAPPPTR